MHSKAAEAADHVCGGTYAEQYYKHYFMYLLPLQCVLTACHRWLYRKRPLVLP